MTLLLLIGFIISGKISDHAMDKNEKYNKAVKIKEQDLFEYGILYGSCVKMICDVYNK